MKQLSALDASFLDLETPQMPMHVGALHVFELPRGLKGRFVDALRKRMASRLPVAPPLRRRLAFMPLNFAHSAWVDADPDMNWHLRDVELARGAGLAELEAQVGELHPQLLDRERPLLQFVVFDGLKPGPGGAKRVEPMPTSPPRTRRGVVRRSAARAAVLVGDGGKKIARRSPAGAEATAKARSR